MIYSISITHLWHVAGYLNASLFKVNILIHCSKKLILKVLVVLFLL